MRNKRRTAKLTPSVILKATQISPDAPVYGLIPKFGPVSFYSQQKRAYNLVSALRLARRLPPGTTVAVVGAGLAGITASAAAHMLGCKVTLFESNEAPFHQQHGNHTRFIHPNVIEWPRQSWMAGETELPFLNWSAGECAGVIDEIEEQWQALGIEPETRMTVQVRDLAKDGAYVTTSHRFYYKKFQVVIVAVGFGEESTFGLDQRSYWSDAHWHQLLSTRDKAIFVSGTGDGGLIDATCLALLRFDQGEILRSVMTFPPLIEIAEALISADDQARLILTAAPTARTRAEASRFLYRHYNELGVSGRLPELKVRTNYKRIVLNSGLPTPLNINSSIINRVIVHTLVGKGAIDYVRGELCPFPGNEVRGQVKLRIVAEDGKAEKADEIVVDDIDTVIVRHGPVGALRAVIGEKAEALYLQHSDQVDQIGREECWHGVKFEIPAFQPTSKLATARALRYREEFESHLQSLDITFNSIWIGQDPAGIPAFFVQVDDANRKKLEAQEPMYRHVRVIAAQAIQTGEPPPSRRPRERLRPLVCGSGITAANGSGTLGFFVKTRDGSVALLTAGHVLGDVLSGSARGPVFQPNQSIEHKTDDENLIAKVTHIMKLEQDGTNRFGVGYAILLPSVQFIPCFSPSLQLPIPQRLTISDDDWFSGDLFGSEVWIGGYNSAIKGRVESIYAVLSGVQYAGGSYRFEDLFVITTSATPEKTAGLSGAVVMTTDGTVLGMVFAGGAADEEGITRMIAFPLAPAISALECEPIFFDGLRDYPAHNTVSS